MFIAKNNGKQVCARCGRSCMNLTKDHFFPRQFLDTLKTHKEFAIASQNNLICICQECNRFKSNKIVPHNWYKYLSKCDRIRLKNKIRTYKKELIKYITYIHYNSGVLSEKQYHGLKGYILNIR